MSGASHFSELLIWKLADELRIEIFTLTSRPAFVRDLKARGQAEDAANSVCRNIAEGFGCETHREFARFLSISRRSLNELQDSLRGAELKRYVTTADCVPARMLFRRLYPALNRFLAYLRRTPDYRHRPASESRTDKFTDRTDPRQGDRTDSRSEDRTDKRREHRTDPRRPDRTDPRQRDRTDSRSEDRTDKRREHRTDPRRPDRTDPRQRDRTDTRQTDRTDKRKEDRTGQPKGNRTDERSEGRTDRRSRARTGQR